MYGFDGNEPLVCKGMHSSKVEQPLDWPLSLSELRHGIFRGLPPQMARICFLNVAMNSEVGCRHAITGSANVSYILFKIIHVIFHRA
jgi:hypothetical protein